MSTLVITKAIVSLYFLHSKIAPPAANADDDAITPKDDDPEGLKLLATTTPLEQAAKLLLPLHSLRSQSLDTWLVSYDVAVRRGKCATSKSPQPVLILYIAEKYLQALRALNSAKAVDATSSEFHVRIADFKTRGTHSLLHSYLASG